MCSILSVRIELIANTRSLMKNQNADFGGARALTALLVTDSGPLVEERIPGEAL
jgi:hypothetical protein